MDTSFFWNIISRELELESDELSSRRVKNWMKRASYTANSHNQYRSSDMPAYLNVLGIAYGKPPALHDRPSDRAQRQPQGAAL